MAGNPTPRFVNTVKTYGVNIDSASVKVDIFTAGSDGSKIEYLAITTDDSAATSASIFTENTATTTFEIGFVDVAAGAGTTTGVPTVNGLNSTDLPFLSTDAHSNEFLNIEEGHKLVISAGSLTTGRILTVQAGVRELTSD